MPVALADAFLIPLVTCDVGVSVVSMQVISTLRAQPDTPLAARLVAQAKADPETKAIVAQQIADVEAMLARSGLPVPARPHGAEYARWANDVVAAFAGAVRPEDPEGALAGLGRALGNVRQTLGLHIAFLDLSEAAPDDAALRELATEQARRYAAHVPRLEAMARFPTLPAPVRPLAEKLASFARLALALDEKSSGAVHLAGLRMIFSRLAEETRGLRATLDG